MDDAKLLFDLLAAKGRLTPRLEAGMRPTIEKALRMLSDRFTGPPGLAYRGAGDFLLKHGKWYTRMVDVPPKQRAPFGYCYGNAIAAAAMYDEMYIEGVALTGDGTELTLHAWNINPEHPDIVIDRTWAEAPGLIYCGVHFSVERADDCTWNGDGCVLVDPDRGYPLYREPWTGEPPDLKWPHSERLDLFRLARTDKAAAQKKSHEWAARMTAEGIDVGPFKADLMAAPDKKRKSQ